MATTGDSSPLDDPTVRKLADLAAEAGLRRVHILAWRDLADVEAGGSELHAARVARLWAAAGLEVTMRTSFAQGHRPLATRDGYRIVRRAGRYAVFPRAAWDELTDRYGHRDGLVEIWNGMPFFSPLWDRGPRIALLHHAHTDMWRTALPPNWARVGDTVERRIAPFVYRRTRIVTLSDSSKRELVNTLRLRPERISVVPPGIDERFGPAGAKAATPLAVAVGRLVPVKRYPVLIRAATDVRRRVPGFRLVIVGEGYERADLEQLVDDLGAGDAVSLPGRLSDEQLVDLYRRAWVLVSTSAAEGWGMSITEAAACATPAVVTRVPGHEDAVVDGHTGLLVDRDDEGGFIDALGGLLADERRRAHLGANAIRRAARFTWGHTAFEVLQALADEALR
ncbi:MAG: glycosyltransferase family 4 protein [Acidimicrobiales bacterium]